MPVVIVGFGAAFIGLFLALRERRQADLRRRRPEPTTSSEQRATAR
jgi:hypothetical protein